MVFNIFRLGLIWNKTEPNLATTDHFADIFHSIFRSNPFDHPKMLPRLDLASFRGCFVALDSLFIFILPFK